MDKLGYPMKGTTMAPTMTGTLAKWGNSQGIRIPKDVCDLLGVKVGVKVGLSVDQTKSEVTITFEKPETRYQRSRKVSMEQLCAGWDGGKVGSEWGGPDVGAEVVE